LIAGSGAIDIYAIDASKTVSAIGITHTSGGAKTGLFVPSQRALFIGAPAIDGKQAEILLYATN
jgi:hypothetical protein